MRVAHGAKVCDLYLCAVIAILISTGVAFGRDPRPSGWQDCLRQAINVSHEGYADSTFARRAQDSAIALATAILSDFKKQNPADSSAQVAILTALGEFSFRGRKYREAVTYWQIAGGLSRDDAVRTDLRLRTCLPVCRSRRRS